MIHVVVNCIISCWILKVKKNLLVICYGIRVLSHLTFGRGNLSSNVVNLQTNRMAQLYLFCMYSVAYFVDCKLN